MKQTLESRYSSDDLELLEDGTVALGEREPYHFRNRDDNLIHTAAQGDTWDSLAEVYYSAISDRPCGLWWIIAEYQPTPVVDPTVPISPGRKVVIPAPIVVVVEVLRGDRRLYQ